MLWKNLESEIKLPSAYQLFRGIDCYSSICALLNFARGIRIYATKSCSERIISHVSSDCKEMGGLLLGQVYSVTFEKIEGHRHLIIICSALPSENYRNSSVSLEMGTEVWTRASEFISRGDVVVGWYHSHPNLGAFFSSIDRETQRAFFSHSYSLGWVIDPFCGEQKIFMGPNSEKYPHDLVVLDHGLEMA